jgi:hypothetical protein
MDFPAFSENGVMYTAREIDGNAVYYPVMPTFTGSASDDINSRLIGAEADTGILSGVAGVQAGYGYLRPASPSFIGPSSPPPIFGVLPSGLPPMLNGLNSMPPTYW